MAGINIRGGKAVLKDVGIRGFDIGIKTTNTDLSAQNIHFNNVRQPFDIAGGKANVIGTRIQEDRSFRQATTNKSRVGWTPDGPALPSKCDKCGAIFPSKRYGFRSSLFYGRDNTDVCPICGNQEAKVSDGFFDLTTEAIGIVEAISNDSQMLASLNKASISIISGKIAVSTGFEAMQAISPRIKELAEKVGSYGFSASWFMAIFLSIVIGWYFSSSQDDNITKPTKQYVHEKCLFIINNYQQSQIEEYKRRTLEQGSSAENQGKTSSKSIPHDHGEKSLPKPKPSKN